MLQPSPAGSAIVESGLAPAKRGYVPTVSPRLRVVLWTVFASFALLGATGAYLLAVTILNAAFPDRLFTNPFTFWTLLGHTGLGVIATVPFLVFGFWHMASSRNRTNKRAIFRGYVTFALGIIIIVSGFALVQLDEFPQLPTGSLSRNIVYFAHVLVPLLAVAAYVWHRKRGPKIRWQYGRAWTIGVGAVVVAMVGAHFLDPRTINKEGPASGVQYFEPSLARTADGNFIPASALMMDDYCMTCHKGIYDDHLHSAHKFSSFNNPAYLASVNETRKVALERDGNVNASRWCAGCHDPAPFFSGKFDDPTFDMAQDPTGHAGVTCVVCHSITHINGPEGNANYTIEEALHYPFASSENTLLQWMNAQLIKGKPELHKKTFLKPLHKSAEFCSTCHKVNLPPELTHYKDFLRGQNHYDSFLQSGLGHGARSFYFPPNGRHENCNTCHMGLIPDDSFGSKDFDGSGVRKRHNHFFPAANTGLFELLKHEEKYAHRAEELQQSIDKNAAYLRGAASDGSDKKLRIDVFGVLPYTDGEGAQSDKLAVIRPTLPELEPGKTYLFEVVVRTLGLGHHFTQGTVDSNEVWVDFEARAGGRVIGKSGALANPDETGAVDEWSHFINVLMLDRHGNRIDRRNPQDIFTPLYNHQIPPGAGQVVHYKLHVSDDVTGPIEVTAKLRYRKFDYKYMEIVYKDQGREIPKLPIIDICEDRVTLPVAGGSAVPPQESPIQPAWQRWNDYGIACLLEGGAGMKRGNLRQAEAAFHKLTTLGNDDAVTQGHLNKARVFLEQGRLQEAAAALNTARTAKKPANWWSIAWFSGLVLAQDSPTPAGLEAAAAEFEKVVDPTNRPRHPDGRIKFDFTKDYVVLAELGKTRFRQAQLEADGSPVQRQFLQKALDAYHRALAVEPEDQDSHFGLGQCYSLLATEEPPGVVTGNSTPIAVAELLALTDRVAGGEFGAIPELAHQVGVFGRQPADPAVPRLRTVRAVLAKLDPAYGSAPPTDQAKLALALSETHAALHHMITPDDIASASVTAIYRQAHPAANESAESRVYYRTDRIPATK